MEIEIRIEGPDVQPNSVKIKDLADIKAVRKQNLAQEIAELQKLSVGIWDNVDPEQYVRDLRSANGSG